MAYEGQVAAYLVHTAGSQFHFQQGKPVFIGGCPVGRVRGFAFAPYLQFQGDAAFFRFGPPGAQGEIPLADAAASLSGKEGGKTGGGPGGFGGEDDPRDVLVQAVDQERPGGPLGGKQGVQGDGDPFTALNRQAGGFIQDYTVVIFKQDGNALQNNPLLRISRLLSQN
jgi:hypothetical protein